MDRLEKLSQSLVNATVDLNPHRLDAALFAFRSPLSRGAILADEVGLGKTIEAGMIIAQLRAERRRRVLCILPAALRKQWNRELLEKFFIDSAIVGTSTYNQAVAQGRANPFDHWGRVSGTVAGAAVLGPQEGAAPECARDAALERVLAGAAERDRRYFEAEMEKLEAWAEDRKEALEREIEELDREIKATKREARQAGDLETKVAVHRQDKDLELRRNDKRRDLLGAQDEVDAKKEQLLADVESRLGQKTTVTELFTIRWRVV